jgi:SAM-dependent methyltransferase
MENGGRGAKTYSAVHLGTNGSNLQGDYPLGTFKGFALKKQGKRDLVNPSLFDHYYLEGVPRVGKLKQIFLEIFGETRGPFSKARPALLLDLGGRDSPYEQLARGLPIRWISTDMRRHQRTEILLDAQALPIKDGIIDILLCTQVLELVPDLFSTAREIHRILKPAGIAIISNPAIFPPYGGARWRIMPEGYRTLLSPFSDCRIDGDCNSVASLFRTLNLYGTILFQKVTVIERIWKLFFCPLLNLLGSWASITFKDHGFVANYFVVAKK